MPCVMQVRLFDYSCFILDLWVIFSLQIEIIKLYHQKTHKRSYY